MPTTSSKRLFIDLETYSSEDIKSAGAYKYVESDDFEILLIAYAWDNGPVRVWDATNRRPVIDSESHRHAMEGADIISAISDSSVVKVAHNCAFERACLQKWLKRDLPPEEWEDTMILAAANGLPLSLDGAGAALNLQAQKIKEGTALINYFCRPCRPTIANGGRKRNLPKHAPEKWERFKDYCVRDVQAAQEIYMRLKDYRFTQTERRLFCLDARICERGVLIDQELAQAAIELDRTVTARHREEMIKLTGVENPGSVSQLKSWLNSRGVHANSLNKKTITDLLDEPIAPDVRRVLELRQQTGKTSTKKYEAMLAAACSDSRVRGILQYYGAGRTGRWAGRMLQVQNLPQNHLNHIGTVRQLIRDRDLDTAEMIYESVPGVLSQLIRTAIVAPEAKTLLVADYSAIEARVIAYLAGEKWRQDTFAAGGDIYCASASRMFKVPVEKHGQNSHLRQKGKIAELALGYGGGVGALKAFGADKMGLSEDEMQDIVSNWRLASPTIPDLWRRVENAAIQAVAHPGRAVTVRMKTADPARARENERLMGAEMGSYSDRFNAGTVCVYKRDKNALRCELPSGRVLSYWAAELDDNGSIRFMAQNQTTRKWEISETWGGKLVENIVQAFARDCLATALLRLDTAGYDIIFHVHDEVIVEAPEGWDWQLMATIMSEPIPWAPGLLLTADGYSTPFYLKD